ncbi:TIGR02678 family protein [Glycomyces sp. NRRL B-16210]|uniref:TIGR02678 family protein n=1 Tax=Glycomyces sp. NRRL B-16210 TaxID=1463821 RepID=UPI00068AE0FF|nr:TIGR02678 family protein [Glycomyces sp. NRRL B-16210]
MSEEIDRDELRRAARTLLIRPLLRSGGPTAGIAATIRKPQHQRLLQQWFERNLGWNLIVDRDVIRLHKIPAMPAAHPEDAPDQRVCVLYCLAAAALEDCGEQTVITEIAKKIADLCVARPELGKYDDTTFSERRSLVEAIRLLVNHGVLVPTRGDGATQLDEKQYIKGDGDAIYDVEHRNAALLLASPVPPNRAKRPGDLIREPVSDTAEGANRHRRHQLMRRLVDEPVMHFDELDEDVWAYFKNQRHLLVSELTDMLGSSVELRIEGAALVDDDLTDIPFPRDRTPQFAALLLAEAIAEQPHPVDEPVPVHVLETAAEHICDQIRMRNIKTIEGKDLTPEAALGTALKALKGMRLVTETPLGVFAKPALGRFRAPARRAPHTPEPTLWPQEGDSSDGN